MKWGGGGGGGGGEELMQSIVQNMWRTVQNINTDKM